VAIPLKRYVRYGKDLLVGVFLVHLEIVGNALEHADFLHVGVLECGRSLLGGGLGGAAGSLGGGLLDGLGLGDGGGVRL